MKHYAPIARTPKSYFYYKGYSLGYKVIDIGAIWKADTQDHKWTNRQDKSFYSGA